MAKFAVIRPDNLAEAEIVEQSELDEWAYEELLKSGIDNPEFDPSWSLTNLIGSGYIIAEIKEDPS